jgi:hypothetical protein
MQAFSCLIAWTFALVSWLRPSDVFGVRCRFHMMQSLFRCCWCGNTIFGFEEFLMSERKLFWTQKAHSVIFLTICFPPDHGFLSSCLSVWSPDDHKEETRWSKRPEGSKDRLNLVLLMHVIVISGHTSLSSSPCFKILFVLWWRITAGSDTQTRGSIVPFLPFLSLGGKKREREWSLLRHYCYSSNS